jgi:hypothetical protein
LAGAAPHRVTINGCFLQEEHEGWNIITGFVMGGVRWKGKESNEMVGIVLYATGRGAQTVRARLNRTCMGCGRCWTGWKKGGENSIESAP